MLCRAGRRPEVALLLSSKGGVTQAGACAMTEPRSALFDCVLRAWHAHETELHGFLVRQAGDADAAEDVLQDVFLKAMRQGQGFCTLDNPRAWLFQVARNALVDASRLRRPTDEVSEELPAPEGEERPPVDALDACVVRNLQHLDAEDRDIIEACDLNAQTVRGFAQAQGLTLPAAKSRLLRARQRLRAALVRNCGVRFDDSGSVCCHLPASEGS